MSPRVTQVVLLCEDRQHEAFARRFLALEGVNPRAIRVEHARKGRGSGEQWVRAAYAKEVQASRSAPHIKGRALVVVIDEDTAATASRSEMLARALAEHGLEPRLQSERIAHVIPARNIETWIAYLAGETVDEAVNYPKLAKQSDCASHVQALKAMCDQGQLRPPAPPSLERACAEYRTRL